MSGCMESVCWCHDSTATVGAGVCGHCGCERSIAVRARANELTRRYQEARERVGLQPVMGTELANLYLLALEAARSGR